MSPRLAWLWLTPRLSQTVLLKFCHLGSSSIMLGFYIQQVGLRHYNITIYYFTFTPLCICSCLRRPPHASCFAHKTAGVCTWDPLLITLLVQHDWTLGCCSCLPSEFCLVLSLLPAVFCEIHSHQPIHRNDYCSSWMCPFNRKTDTPEDKTDNVL